MLVVIVVMSLCLESWDLGIIFFLSHAMDHVTIFSALFKPLRCGHPEINNEFRRKSTAARSGRHDGTESPNGSRGDSCSAQDMGVSVDE